MQTRPHERTDLELDFTKALAACAAGDRAALRSFTMRYRRRCSAWQSACCAVAILPKRRCTIASYEFGKMLSSFDPARGEPRSWIFAILRHRALNILRGEAQTDLVDDFEPFGLVSDDADPESLVSGLSDAGALKRCLERLDPARRNVIVLAYVNGLSHGEFAGKLGVPLGTVKSWIRRSLSSLRECLA